MPFVRPIVYVYQEFSIVTVAPDVPDLNCCLVGPAYYIQDYPADKTDIQTSDFVKSGYDADAKCGADGSSEGRPDPNSTFLVLSNPPNHISGGVLDADSVNLVFDDLYIELDHSNDLTFTDDSNEFGSALGDFVTNKVKAGDRLVMTKSDGSNTVIKTVKEVVDANNLKTTTTKKTTEDIGTSGTVRWRIEHAMDDQNIDVDLYTTIVGNEITIKTGASGILVTYESATWPVNYSKMYIGYRELRTDLQDVTELESSDSIEGAIGSPDERNPLGAGAQVAFANTGAPIQVFGVATDDLAGHQSARDRMTTRDDIYAIVPLTDKEKGQSGADWITIINTWKTHCVEFADPTEAKFRVVIGSYDILPEDKSSAPPSTDGSTESVAGATVDVFVDPHADTEFVTDGVDSDSVLDILRSATIQNLSTWGGGEGETFFKAAYSGQALLGAIGEKRLRAASALGGAVNAQAGDYAVRQAIVAAEGVTPRATVLSGLTEGDDAGSYKITGSAGDFSDAGEGDIAALTDSTHDDDAYFIKTVAVDGSSITLEFPTGGASGTTVKVRVYRPSDLAGFMVQDCDIDSASRQIQKTGGFTSAVPGDIAVILRSGSGTETPGNVGVWVVSAVDASGNYVTLGGTGTLVDDAGSDVNVAIYHAISSRGGASLTTRARLTRLRDNTASFLTTVNPGELIEIPYPAETDPTKWDTATTTWPIDTVVSDEILDADLDDLEELAPKVFVAGFSGDCSYRIAITLDREAQVEELNATISSLQNSRCLMVWPNEILVSGLENALTGEQNRQTGQYLACAVGGMTAGLPSHQGFTFIGIGGVSQLFNSNFYFTNDQLTELRGGGWYVFVQDSETSLPYTIHAVTTNVSAYAFGEFMNVKNFDFIALYFKDILYAFLGRYNITPETLTAISGSLNAGGEYLMLRKFPKIGAPLLDMDLKQIEQMANEVDGLNVYIDIDMPKVLNKIGLYLKAV